MRTSVSVQAPRLTHQVGNFGEEELLLRRRKWNRRVERRQPDNGSIEIVECLFVDDRGNFSGQPSSARVLVQNDDFVGLLYGGSNRRAIKWSNRPQVEDFDLDPFFTQDFRGLDRGIQHGGIGDHAKMTPLARDPRVPERNYVIDVRNFFFDSAVQIFAVSYTHL